MTPRISFEETNQGFMDGLFKIGGYLKKSGVGPKLHELINFRVSQINGCAYCLDMHYKDLIVLGETEQRIYSLPAWRECPYYTEKERAALDYAEAVTACKIDDPVYAALTPHFTKQEIADLTLGIGLINTWNRINIAFQVVPGGYQPGQYA